MTVTATGSAARGVRRLLGREPALYLGLAAIVVQIAAGLLGLSPDQQSSVNALVVAASGALTAFFVVREGQFAALLGLVKAAVAVGLGFGLHLPATQQAVIMALLTAIGGLVTRSQVVAPVSASGIYASGAAPIVIGPETNGPGPRPVTEIPGHVRITTTTGGTDRAGPTDLDRAIGNAGLVLADDRVLEGPSIQDGVALETASSPDRRRVLLVRDPSGVATWHLPRETHPAARFEVTTRPIGDAASARFSVFEFPVGPALGDGAATAFVAWEKASRPAVVTWFPPRSGLQDGVPLNDAAWRRLTSGRTLLFLHGIFSSCASGFAGLLPDRALWNSLSERYGDRIIAYDHPTASVSPEENVRAFLALVPDGVRLDLDVVCHSRGGLVARVLDGQLGPAGPEVSTKVTVRRIVFAGTPNGGTALVEKGRWNALVNRFTNLIDLAPPGPWSVATVPLEGVLELVKSIAEHGEVDLPGLSAMEPGSPLYAALDHAAGSRPVYFAIDADFEPRHTLRHLFDATDDILAVGDPLIDTVFEQKPNDVAVPSAGVADPASVEAVDREIRGFPVPVERRLSFDRSAGVWHCSYFEQPETRRALLTWLQPADQMPNAGG